VLKRSGVGAEKAMAEQPRKGSLKVSGLLSAAAIIKLSGKRILTVGGGRRARRRRSLERVFRAALARRRGSGRARGKKAATTRAQGSVALATIVGEAAIER
jgi:hypothetical protein